MAFCSKCGSIVDNNAKFCNHCGTTLGMSGHSVQQNVQPNTQTAQGMGQYGQNPRQQNVQPNTQTAQGMGQYGQNPRQQNVQQPNIQNGQGAGQYGWNPQQQQQGFTQQNFSSGFASFNNTVDSTESFDPQDIQNNKVMAILAYLGILVLIPLLAAKESRFARFHTNQGLVLFIAEIIYSIAYSILTGVILAISWRLYFLVTIIGLLGLAFLVLSIIGIINAAGGKAKELPVIGKIKILK